MQSLANLLGEHAGITGVLEGFLSSFAGDLVVAVPVGRATDKDGGDDQRADHADDADDVAKDALMGPFLEAFRLGFGKAEIDDAGEILIGAVILVCREQFLGAVQTERLPSVGVHQVLACLASIEREQSSASTLAAGFVREHAPILIVGMSHDHDEAGAGVKLEQRLP
jgi:hypothetical protein